MFEYTHHQVEAIEAKKQSLKISEEHFHQYFLIEKFTTSEKWQESPSFLGLLTSYQVKTCKVTLRNPYHSDLMCLGLPEGNEFTTTTESCFDRKCDSLFARFLVKSCESILFVSNLYRALHG